MYVDGPKSCKFVLDFMLKNLNDLRYKETQGLIKDTIEYLAKHDGYLDILL